RKHKSLIRARARMAGHPHVAPYRVSPTWKFWSGNRARRIERTMMDLNLPPFVNTVLALGILALAALFANFGVKALLLRILNKALGYTAWGRDAELRQHGVIERLANI